MWSTPRRCSAVGERSLHRGGARVVADQRAVGAAQGAELHRAAALVAATGSASRDEQLVVAHAVEVAGVEQRDAASRAAWIVAMLSSSSAGP